MINFCFRQLFIVKSISQEDYSDACLKIVNKINPGKKLFINYFLPFNETGFRENSFLNAIAFLTG